MCLYRRKWCELPWDDGDESVIISCCDRRVQVLLLLIGTTVLVTMVANWQFACVLGGVVVSFTAVTIFYNLLQRTILCGLCRSLFFLISPGSA